MEFEIESDVEFVEKPKKKSSRSKVPTPENFSELLNEFYSSMEKQKYRRHYQKLIERAVIRKLDIYVEKHHIIPTCLKGINCLDNIVELTPEEHYVAHQFLAVAFPDNRKLMHAAKMMTTNKWGRRSNKLYGWLRERLSEAMKNRVVSEETRAKNRAYGNSAEAKAHFDKVHAAQIGKPIPEERKAKIAIKSKENGISAETRAKMVASRIANKRPISEETRNKMSESSKGKKATPETILKMSISQKARPPRSPETCAKISENNRNRPAPSDETKAKISASLTGKKLPPETTAKMSESRKGKKQSDETVNKRVATFTAKKAVREILAAWSCAL